MKLDLRQRVLDKLHGNGLYPKDYLVSYRVAHRRKGKLFNGGNSLITLPSIVLVNRCSSSP